MNKKLTLLAALALGGCAMATGSTLAELQASTWQLQGASGDTFTLQVAGDKVAGKGGCNRYFGGITQQGDGVSETNTINLNVKALPNGLYFLRLNAGNTIGVAKLTVSK